MGCKIASKLTSQALVTLSAFVALGIAKADAQSVTCVQPLVFGSVTACGVSNTITITPSGSVSSASCVRGGAPANRAQCQIFGTIPPQPIQITFAAPSAVMTQGANTMKVTGLDMIATGQTQTTMTTFAATIPIGGTLNIDASQPAGVYQGQIVINANYL